MNNVNLLIALPTKTDQQYFDRFEACKETWLKDCPVEYRGFSDADLGLTEINQHDNATDPIRTNRTKLMVKWAYDRGFDYIYRVDTDAYVWVNRLLASGFEHHDYMGWCLNTPETPGQEWCINTAHGGIGFTLSRRAMKVIVDAPIERYGDGKYWGDLWAGHQLWKSGIRCHRDTRFLDGGRTSTSNHYGNILAAELPDNHQYISIHPVLPIYNMLAIHERFKHLSAETTPPEKQLWET